MNILINCSNLKIGGGLQVAHSFIHELKSLDEHSYIIVASTNVISRIHKDRFPKHMKFIEYSIKPSFFLAITGKDITLEKIERKYKIEKVFTVFGPSYWKPKSKHICGFAKPQYIYLDSPFFNKISKFDYLFLRIKRFFHLFSFGNSSDTLISELWDVSDKLKKLFPAKKVYTVTNTYNQVFEDRYLWKSTISLPEFTGVTLLTISANYPHKNLDIIPEVILYLKSTIPDFNFRFLLTLNEEDMVIEDKRILEHIVFLGKINIDQCPILYEQSDFMFLPTLLECFSASYAEAMKMEVPILTSDLSFARSICGEGAEYFKPLDATSIGNEIYKLSLNQGRQNELKISGLKQLENFDTSKSRAQKYLQIILNS